MKILIDKVPAGPEMDAAIAEVRRGHRYRGSGRIENIEGTVSDFCIICNEPAGYHHLNNYRRLEEAWELFEELKLVGATLGWTKRLVPYVNLPFPKWVGAAEREYCGTVYGETHAEAICRAFLKVNGVMEIEAAEKRQDD